MKSILTVKFRSWFKSIAIPKNDEYLDFLRRYDLSVERILDLLEQFILAANQTRKLKALNVETRNTEYDQFLVFLFRQLGEALDLEFLNTSDQLASKLSSQECLDKISSILNHSEKLANLKSLFKDELALLKEIKDGSSNKSNDTL